MTISEKMYLLDTGMHSHNYDHYTFVTILQQWRLFPYLAAEYALLHFIYTFFADFVSFSVAMVVGEKGERQVCVLPHCGNDCSAQ